MVWVSLLRAALANGLATLAQSDPGRWIEIDAYVGSVTEEAIKPLLRGCVVVQYRSGRADTWSAGYEFTVDGQVYCAALRSEPDHLQGREWASYHQRKPGIVPCQRTRHGRLRVALHPNQRVHHGGPLIKLLTSPRLQPATRFGLAAPSGPRTPERWGVANRKLTWP